MTLSWTIWWQERYRGVELHCDYCNAHFEPEKNSGLLWWYIRADSADRYPCCFCCDDCKGDMQ
jgi:hypothetical protein